MSLVTTLPAAHMLFGPIVTPGTTKDWAAIHEPALIVIGLVIRSKLGLEKSCDPVQRKTLCEMQQFASISTLERLKIVTNSPIHTCSPTVSRQGNEIFTPFRMTTPFPTVAPKRCNSLHLIVDGIGNGFRKKRHFVTTHSASTQRGLPLLKFVLSNDERSICFI